MQLSQLHTNNRLLVALSALLGFNLIIAVILPFVKLRGIDFSQFVQIQGAFMTAMLIADPLISPLADKYGRRAMIIAGSLFWAIGHIAIWISSNIWSYMAAEVLLGIGMAAYKPAFKALMYEGFVAANREEEHYDMLTLTNVWQSIAAAVSSVIGGLMFIISPNVTAALTALSTFGLVGLAWKLTEPPFHKKIGDEVPSLGSLMISAWKCLSAPHTRWIVILPGLITGSTITLFWSFQQISKDAGISVVIISALLAVHIIGRAFFAWKCKDIVKHLNVKECFMMCTVLVTVGFAAMAFLPLWASFIPFVLSAGLAFILASTMGEELVNRHTASEVRSTSMGAYSFIGRLVSLGTLTGCGMLQPVVGLPWALASIGAITMGLAVFSLTRLPRATAEPKLKAAA